MPRPPSSNTPPPSTPVRRTINVLRMRDPATGQTHIVEESEVHFELSHDGSIDQTVLHHDRFVCRCDPRVPPGGSCVVCGGLVCVTHRNECVDCGAPLCGRHTTYTVENGRRLPRCRSCGMAAGRKRLLNAVRGVLVSLFMERAP